jgi:3-isopropylmalate/(R)-2-methylmalate dehydratase small subunit
MTSKARQDVIRGPVAVLGDYVSADVILPARFSFVPREEMAQQALRELGEGVNERVRRHPILVVGKAFGYGTGRESPSRALNSAGVKAIVGGPFARMFFRNAINNGILVLECPDLLEAGIAEDDIIEIRPGDGSIRYKDREFSVPAVSGIVGEIVSACGLIPYAEALLQGVRA